MTDPVAIKLLKEAANYGLVGGVSTSIHNHNGGTSICSMTSGCVVKKDSAKCFATSLYMSVLLPYLYEAIIQLTPYKKMANNQPKLTKRETECLVWSAEGKTSEQVAQILSIKNTTVVFHLRNVIKKFNVTNRNQAIAQAIILGVISPKHLSEDLPKTYNF